MSNRIGPTVQHVWNGAISVQQFFSVCDKHNSLPLGPKQLLSPSTKELHALANSHTFIAKELLDKGDHVRRRFQGYNLEQKTQGVAEKAEYRTPMTAQLILSSIIRISNDKWNIALC